MKPLIDKLGFYKAKNGKIIRIVSLKGRSFGELCAIGIIQHADMDNVGHFDLSDGEVFNSLCTTDYNIVSFVGHKQTTKPKE